MHYFLSVVLMIMGFTQHALASDTLAPITGFQAEKYQGVWYEIARLDNRFERHLDHVSAVYTLQPSGKLEVINRGFHAKKQVWKKSKGTAYFAKTPNEAYLKVSFFRPFYGDYIVFDLDNAYQHAYVTGNDKDYLWYLSRTPTVTEAEKQRFITVATNNGFDLSKLVYPKQTLTK